MENTNLQISKSYRQLLMVGHIEGISYLVLLLIAMPLKYFWHQPLPVRITGITHGILFVIFILALIRCGWVMKWPVRKYAIAFISSLIPLGTFYLDHFLKTEISIRKP